MIEKMWSVETFARILLFVSCTIIYIYKSCNFYTSTFKHRKSHEWSSCFNILTIHWFKLLPLQPKTKRPRGGGQQKRTSDGDESLLFGEEDGTDEPVAAW